jgi:hypothetical protein
LGSIWYFGGPRQPGVKYTPGVPPWMEKGAGPYRAASNYQTVLSAAAKQQAATHGATTPNGGGR